MINQIFNWLLNDGIETSKALGILTVQGVNNTDNIISFIPKSFIFQSCLNIFRQEQDHAISLHMSGLVNQPNY